VRVKPPDDLDPRSFLEHADEWLVQLREQHADGAVRRDDLEGNEAWNRLSGEPELFGVETMKIEDPPGWQVSFWALEFVREQPLESALRAAIAMELRGVAGVTEVREEDREVYWVAGSTSGDDLTRAAARAVDSFADRLRAEFPDLR
jgi:hypothetical protein